MSDTSSRSPGSGRGRRSNGLPAADWGALVDLDPRLSEALLASLEAAGVAAYVEPAGGQDALSRAAQHPARPLDRLWVDPIRADAARQVVTAEVADLTTLLAEADPGATAHGFVQAVPRTAAARVLTPPALPDPPSPPPPAVPTAAPPTSSLPTASTDASADGPPQPTPDATGDPDEVWRQIVEGYHREAEGPVPPWPVSEDVDPPGRKRFSSRPERSGEVADDATPARRRRDDAEAESALPDWVEPAALEDEGHYVPPPPPPVPRLAPRKLAAAATLLVGFLLMFVPGLLLQPRTGGVAILGMLLTVAGAGALIYLMRDTPPTDSGPEDGAVV